MCQKGENCECGDRGSGFVMGLVVGVIVAAVIGILIYKKDKKKVLSRLRRWLMNLVENVGMSEEIREKAKVNLEVAKRVRVKPKKFKKK